MENETFVLNNFIFNNSNEEKIPGITIDNKLTFKSYIKILCKNLPKNRDSSIIQMVPRKC